MCPDDICGPMFHLKVRVTKPGHWAPSDCCSVTTDKHHRILRRCIPCSRLTQQIKSTGFLLQSSEEEIVSLKWNTVFYGRFKIPLVCVLWMCLLDLIRIWTKNSGNSSNLRAVAAHTAVMGWLKHSASSSRPRCWSCLTKKQTGDSSQPSVLPGRAQCGGGLVLWQSRELISPPLGRNITVTREPGQQLARNV